ncbi:hypothetical protein AAFC00_005907 [Neodothiora populina]|uniref:Cyclin-like protein n=1 Tax=Neodothiora populina TaxID=2781224 RepID=A0ABR3P6A3_9PEZI
MPSFYPRANPGHLPLTPPEFVPYDTSACARVPHHQDSYMAQHCADSRQDLPYEYTRGYNQPTAHINSQPMYHPHQGMYQQAPQLPPISSYYEPLGAPILPPLRTQGASLEEEMRLRMDQNQRSQAAQQAAVAQQPPVKEEKATGGVSAKLDYDMERMTDFVAETALGIIRNTVSVSPPFRKWVLQVLSATRLPSATILLSLHYLTVRLRDHPPRPSSSSENQIYRLLCVALILGSKFLDDNTFINRSWSDVSGIRVSELNELEMEWLSAIDYNLHCDPEDPQGFSTWHQAWKEYESRPQQSRSARLSPLNTNVQRQTPIRSSHSPYQQQYAKGFYADFTPQSSRASSTYGGTPYLSADPWNRSEPANSMEAFYNSRQRYPTLDELEHANGRASQEHARRLGYGGCAVPLPPLASFVSPWNQPSWSAPHPHGCNCMSCARQYMSYMPTMGYQAQTVVG